MSKPASSCTPMSISCPEPLHAGSWHRSASCASVLRSRTGRNVTAHDSTLTAKWKISKVGEINLCLKQGRATTLPFPDSSRGVLAGWLIPIQRRLRTSATKKRNRMGTLLSFIWWEFSLLSKCVKEPKANSDINCNNPNKRWLFSVQWGNWIHNCCAGVTMLWSAYKFHVSHCVKSRAGQSVIKKWREAPGYHICFSKCSAMLT